MIRERSKLAKYTSTALRVACAQTRLGGRRPCLHKRFKAALLEAEPMGGRRANGHKGVCCACVRPTNCSWMRLVGRQHASALTGVCYAVRSVPGWLAWSASRTMTSWTWQLMAKNCTSCGFLATDGRKLAPE